MPIAEVKLPRLLFYETHSDPVLCVMKKVIVSVRSLKRGFPLGWGSCQRKLTDEGVLRAIGAYRSIGNIVSARTYRADRHIACAKRSKTIFCYRRTICLRTQTRYICSHKYDMRAYARIGLYRITPRVLFLLHFTPRDSGIRPKDASQSPIRSARRATSRAVYSAARTRRASSARRKTGSA